MALYLALGWSVVLIIGPVSTIPPAKILWLIALGGVLYTVGVLFHDARRFPYQNAIWRGFVNYPRKRPIPGRPYAREIVTRQRR